jgi:hypothetical protein
MISSLQAASWLCARPHRIPAGELLGSSGAAPEAHGLSRTRVAFRHFRPRGHFICGAGSFPGGYLLHAARPLGQDDEAHQGRRLLLLVIVGSIPTAIIGLDLQGHL